MRYFLLSYLFCAQCFGAAKYPSDFLWGVAFSAHQTEGVEGGGEFGDWWIFENSRINGISPIANGDTTAIAVDHWNRYPEDFQIAQDLGVNTVRISLAWEKIEPQPGVFNLEALNHYRDVLLEMHQNELRPMVAFHHFTHPQWFHDIGGWQDPKSALYFLRYAHRVVTALGDLCDLWITFNEPMVLVNMGYVNGSIPPLIQDRGIAVDVAFNLAKAHMMTVSMIHSIQPRSEKRAGVGVVSSLQIYKAATSFNPADHAMAKLIDRISNWAFLDVIVHGKVNPLDQALIVGVKGRLPSLDWPERGSIDGTEQIPLDGSWKSDWLGINYYTVYKVKTGVKGIEILPAGPVNDNGWTYFPEGLKEITLKTAHRYPHTPLIVSENGLADAQDLHRPQFIRTSLGILDELKENGVDIRGYYHWSLMDNFEWLEGYRMKFGLVEIFFHENLKRVPRPSAFVFQEEIRKRLKPTHLPGNKKASQ